MMPMGLDEILNDPDFSPNDPFSIVLIYQKLEAQGSQNALSYEKELKIEGDTVSPIVRDNLSILERINRFFRTIYAPDSLSK